MTHTFVIADVFPETAFGGNPLAVFTAGGTSFAPGGGRRHLAAGRGSARRVVRQRRCPVLLRPRGIGRGGRTVAVRVGGSTVLVGEGNLTVPAGL
jgi:predicted PhzF superfamily epimerase YddE/YHI9